MGEEPRGVTSCDILRHCEKHSIPFPWQATVTKVAARAKAAYASLTSEDVAFALKKWLLGRVGEQ